MYRMVVAWRIRRVWGSVQRREPEGVLKEFAERFEYSFAGDHALGGVRNTRASMSAWFDRLFRLLPDVGFQVDDVLVRGWPWHTRAVALVSVTGTVAGEPYRNEVAQTIELRWGRVVRIHNLEDTQILDRALERMGRAGVDEAVAPAIEDPVPMAA